MTSNAIIIILLILTAPVTIPAILIIYPSLIISLMSISIPFSIFIARINFYLLLNPQVAGLIALTTCALCVRMLWNCIMTTSPSANVKYRRY